MSVRPPGAARKEPLEALESPDFNADWRGTRADIGNGSVSKSNVIKDATMTSLSTGSASAPYMNSAPPYPPQAFSVQSVGVSTRPPQASTHPPPPSAPSEEVPVHGYEGPLLPVPVYEAPLDNASEVLVPAHGYEGPLHGGIQESGGMLVDPPCDVSFQADMVDRIGVGMAPCTCTKGPCTCHPYSAPPPAAAQQETASREDVEAPDPLPPPPDPPPEDTSPPADTGKGVLAICLNDKPVVQSSTNQAPAVSSSSPLGSGIGAFDLQICEDQASPASASQANLPDLNQTETPKVGIEKRFHAFKQSCFRLYFRMPWCCVIMCQLVVFIFVAATSRKGIKVGIDERSFVYANGPALLHRKAFDSAWAQSSGSFQNSYVQQSSGPVGVTREVHLIYSSHDVFTEKKLLALRNFELSLRALPGWQRLCHNSLVPAGGSDASTSSGCDPGESLLNIVWPQRLPSKFDEDDEDAGTQPAKSVFDPLRNPDASLIAEQNTRSVHIGRIALDGKGDYQLPLAAVLSVLGAQGEALDRVARFLPGDWRQSPPEGTSVADMFQSHFLFNLRVGEGGLFKTEEEATDAWVLFVAEELYPALTESEFAEEFASEFAFHGSGLDQADVHQTLRADFLYGIGSLVLVFVYMMFRMRSILEVIVSIILFLESLMMGHNLFVMITGMQTISIACCLVVFVVLAIGADVFLNVHDAWFRAQSDAMNLLSSSSSSTSFNSKAADEEKMMTVFDSALTQVGPKVIAAFLCTFAVGLIGLASSLQMVREFSLILALSVFALFILMVIMFPIVLFLSMDLEWCGFGLEKKMRAGFASVLPRSTAVVLPTPSDDRGLISTSPSSRRGFRYKDVCNASLHQVRRHIICVFIFLAILFLVGLFLAAGNAGSSSESQIFPEDHNQVVVQSLRSKFLESSGAYGMALQKPWICDMPLQDWETCEDQSSNCASRVANGDCTGDSEMMAKVCPRSCGACDFCFLNWCNIDEPKQISDSPIGNASQCECFEDAGSNEGGKWYNMTVGVQDLMQVNGIEAHVVGLDASHWSYLKSDFKEHFSSQLSSSPISGSWQGSAKPLPQAPLVQEHWRSGGIATWEGFKTPAYAGPVTGMTWAKTCAGEEEECKCDGHVFFGPMYTKLADGARYVNSSGFLQGLDIKVEDMTVREAKDVCDELPSCLGFTFQGWGEDKFGNPIVYETEMRTIFFKATGGSKARIKDYEGWTTFKRNIPEFNTFIEIVNGRHASKPVNSSIACSRENFGNRSTGEFFPPQPHRCWCVPRELPPVKQTCYCGGASACNYHTQGPAGVVNYTEPRMTQASPEFPPRALRAQSSAGVVKYTELQLTKASLEFPDRRLSISDKGFATVGIVWGVVANDGEQDAGPFLDEGAWSFDEDFHLEDPWVQRSMLQMVQDLPDDLRVQQQSEVGNWLMRFVDWLEGKQRTFPSTNVQKDLAEFLKEHHEFEEHFLVVSGRVRAVQIPFDLQLHMASSAKAVAAAKEAWDQWVQSRNSQASARADKAWHFSDLWVRAEAHSSIAHSTALVMGVSLVVGFVVLSRPTLAWYNLCGLYLPVIDCRPFLALLVTLNVAMTFLAEAFFIFGVLQWEVSGIESLGLVALAGHAFSYSTRIGFDYMQADDCDDDRYSSDALASAGRHTLEVVALQLVAMVFLPSCQLRFFAKFGAVMFIAAVITLLHALLFLPAMLMVCGRGLLATTLFDFLKRLQAVVALCSCCSCCSYNAEDSQNRYFKSHEGQPESDNEDTPSEDETAPPLSLQVPPTPGNATATNRTAGATASGEQKDFSSDRSVCPGGHGLQRVKADSNMFCCNICGEVCTVDLFSCRECDYDVCQLCYVPAATTPKGSPRDNRTQSARRAGPEESATARAASPDHGAVSGATPSQDVHEKDNGDGTDASTEEGGGWHSEEEV